MNPPRTTLYGENYPGRVGEYISFDQLWLSGKAGLSTEVTIQFICMLASLDGRGEVMLLWARSCPKPWISSSPLPIRHPFGHNNIYHCAMPQYQPVCDKPTVTDIQTDEASIGKPGYFCYARIKALKSHNINLDGSWAVFGSSVRSNLVYEADHGWVTEMTVQTLWF